MPVILGKSFWQITWHFANQLCHTTSRNLHIYSKINLTSKLPSGFGWNSCNRLIGRYFALESSLPLEQLQTSSKWERTNDSIEQKNLSEKRIFDRNTTIYRLRYIQYSYLQITEKFYALKNK